MSIYIFSLDGVPYLTFNCQWRLGKAVLADVASKLFVPQYQGLCVHFVRLPRDTCHLFTLDGKTNTIRNLFFPLYEIFAYSL